MWQARLGERRDLAGPISGSRRSIAVRPGFGISTSDVCYHENACNRHISDGDYLRLHYRLAGHAELEDNGRAAVPVEMGNISLLVNAADSIKSERIFADQSERSVTLICERDFASQMLEREASGLPGFVRDFLIGREQRFAFASLPIVPQLRTLVEDILDPPMGGKLAALMVEARAIELLCFTMQQLSDAPSSQAIRARDLQRVKDVCALLDDPEGRAMSIRDLCRAVAWNETQMTECFKQVTGTTISHYRQQVRMEEARRMLASSDASVTEIALTIGFEHPSNFAKAFKKTFGYAPSVGRPRKAHLN